MTYLIIAWLTALTVAQVISKPWVLPGKREFRRETEAQIAYWPEPPTAEFIQGNRVEEIIKGKKGNVSIDDVLI